MFCAFGQFDGVHERWHELKQADKPTKRCRHAGAIDAWTDRLFVFAGQDGPDGSSDKSLDDAFVLDLAPLLKDHESRECGFSNDDQLQDNVQNIELSWRPVQPKGVEKPEATFGIQAIVNNNTVVVVGGSRSSQHPSYQLALSSSVVNGSVPGEWRRCSNCPTLRNGAQFVAGTSQALDRPNQQSEIIGSASHSRMLFNSPEHCPAWPDLSLVYYGGMRASRTSVLDGVEKFAIFSSTQPSTEIENGQFIRGNWDSVSVSDIEVRRAYGGSAMYDDSLVVFGGYSQATDRFGRQLGLAFNDLLVFVGNRPSLQNVWYKAQLDDSPRARFGQSLVPLVIFGEPKVVMFGGFFHSPFGDTWKTTIESLKVKQVTASDVDPDEPEFPFINATTFLGGLLASVCVFAIIFAIVVRRWSRTRHLGDLFARNGRYDNTEPSAEAVEERLQHIPTIVFCKEEPPTADSREQQSESKALASANVGQSISSGSIYPEETIPQGSVSWFQDTCTICYVAFEEQERIAILPCEHVFHIECIKEWLRRKPNCPLCKADSLSQLRPENEDGSTTTNTASGCATTTSAAFTPSTSNVSMGTSTATVTAPVNDSQEDTSVPEVREP